MISALQIPAWGQRDPRWAKQRLGTTNGTTIGGQGCLITSIAMMNAGFDPGNQLTPNQVDDLFTAHAGYANGNLVIWNKINQLLANCSTQGQIFCQDTAAPVGDIKARLDGGQLVILQVGFNGISSNMHFVLALGYNGDDIIFNDPWYGDRSSFQSRRYGSGVSSKDILAIHYFADGIPPVKPEQPVAKPAVEQPMLGYQRVIIATANCNYRVLPNTDAAVVKKFLASQTLDFRGFVHGQVVDGTDIWFVGRYSNGFAHSHNFSDTGTHDLADLTNELFPPAPTPPVVQISPPVIPAIPEAPVEPEPQPPVVEPTPAEPAPETSAPVLSEEELEEKYKWNPDATIPQKYVSNENGASVVDAITGEVVKQLPHLELVAPLGGYFRFDGVACLRTQSSVDNGRWYGIREIDVADVSSIEPIEAEQEPTPPAPGDIVLPTPPTTPGGTVDGIKPPEEQEVGSVFDDDFGLEDPTDDIPDTAPRIPTEDILQSVRHFVMGIVLSPLRLFGRIGKLIKGVEKTWKS